MPPIYQEVEQLIDIGHVKVPCQHKGFGHPVIKADHRLQVFQVVGTKSPITQMPHEEFTGKLHIMFQPLNIINTLRIVQAEL